MTTKEQERIALEKIKKIIEELGEDSYLSYAFEGCFEDAEQNIKDDAAYSWKQRAESAHREVNHLRELCEEARAETKREKSVNESYTHRIGLLERQSKYYEAISLDEDIAQDMLSLANTTVSEVTEKMLTAASTMARLSASPSDIAYTHAVKLFNEAEQTRNQAIAAKKRLTEVLKVHGSQKLIF